MWFHMYMLFAVLAGICQHAVCCTGIWLWQMEFAGQHIREVEPNHVVCRRFVLIRLQAFGSADKFSALIIGKLRLHGHENNPVFVCMHMPISYTLVVLGTAFIAVLCAPASRAVCGPCFICDLYRPSAQPRLGPHPLVAGIMLSAAQMLCTVC